MKKCWIHDYQIIDRIGKKQLRHQIRGEVIYSKKGPATRLCRPGKTLFVKICLECGSLTDEVKTQAISYRKQAYRELERMNKAKEIYRKVNKRA